MQKVVEAAVHALSEGLGERLEAIYLFGSMAEGRYDPALSDVNLLAVVSEGCSIHRLREAFLPLWREHGAGLRRAPLMAMRGTLDRHLQLHPDLAHHLASSGIRLVGDDMLTSALPTPDPRESFARLSYEAMNASRAVAAESMEPELAPVYAGQLRRLHKRLDGSAARDHKSNAQLLAEVQHHLKQELDNNPALKPWVSPTRPTTSLLLPRLEGAYKELGQLIMSFSVLSAHQVANTDWHQLTLQLAKHYAGLKLVTSTQLRLIVEYENPLAIVFQRYEHEWGVDVLRTVPVSSAGILRHAARVASRIEIDLLPNAYLTIDEGKIGKLIHDFQNKLLNIQLEHELLNRLQDVEKFQPAEPLLDRTARPETRIDAILSQAGEWADYYTQRMVDSNG